MTRPPRPRLVPMTPFSLEGDLGKAYNEALELLPDDAWAVLMDHDMMLTTREWYRQLEEAVAFIPHAGAIVAMANRIAAPWQQIGDPDNHDVAHHRQFGRERLKARTLLDITNTKGFGGVLFALSKAAWREVGGFAEGATLCVDHSIHFKLRDAGRRIYLLESLYVYHWRRAFGDALPPTLLRVHKCPCRGPEPMPTVRIPLP